MVNQAIEINNDAVNNSFADIAINTSGSDWYWAVTAVMAASTLAFIGLSATKPRSERIFHYITASITLVASIAYFSMASNLGWVGIDVEFHRSGSTVSGDVREIFYVRYIDWFVTTPLLLLDLLLTAGMPSPTIAYTILIDWVMIVTGLVGALVATSYKWGYFTFGCVALFYVVYMLAFEARLHANALGKDIGRVFLMCGAWTACLWMIYPIAWGLCEGGNVIGTDGEAVFYGVLDICAKPIFGALLIFGHRNIETSRLGLHIRDYNNTDFSVSKSEKETGAAAPAHNGTTAATGTTDTTGTTASGVAPETV